MGVTYVYDDWAGANVELDRVSQPSIINLLPVSGKLYFKNNQFKDEPNCMLAFADRTDFEANTIENNNVIEKCKRRSMEFFHRLNQSGLFEPVPEELPYSVFYDKLDENITGVCIEVRLKEITGITFCPGQPYGKLYK